MIAILALLKLISPREWAGLALIVALGVGCWKIYDAGEAHVRAADERAKQAQIVHNREVESRAQTLAASQVATLKAQLTAKPAADAPHLVCPRPKPTGGVRHDGGAGSVDHGGPVDPSSGPSHPDGDDEVIDFGPPLDKLHADADARLKAAQDYIRDCQAIGACKK